MKITLSHYGITHSVETPNDDLTATEVIDHCIGLMRAAGWHESTLQDSIIELAENYKDDDN